MFYRRFHSKKLFIYTWVAESVVKYPTPIPDSDLSKIFDSDSGFRLSKISNCGSRLRLQPFQNFRLRFLNKKGMKFGC